MKSSPPREVSDIPEEEKEAPCCSGSLDFSEFDFLAEEEITRSSSDEDEVDEVDRSEIFRDYLASHRPKIVPRPSLKLSLLFLRL